MSRTAQNTESLEIENAKLSVKVQCKINTVNQRYKKDNY